MYDANIDTMIDIKVIIARKIDNVVPNEKCTSRYMIEQLKRIKHKLNKRTFDRVSISIGVPVVILKRQGD
jgi:hypothetical protein